ncbi:MAG: FAD-binding oxidoreductase [Verrucomicrobiota bacterium]
MDEEPTRLNDLKRLVLQQQRVVPSGGRTKPLLSPSAGGFRLSLKGLRGISSLNPRDQTITALAGTPLTDVRAALDEHRQRLPFQAPWEKEGSTVGGAIATGLPDVSDFRFGRLGESLVAAKFICGSGELIHTGAKVLKSSAGLNLGGFLAGSLGRLGILGEVTLRTLPVPQETVTVQWNCASIQGSLSLLHHLSSYRRTFEALELRTNPFRVQATITGESDLLAKVATSLLNRSPIPGEILPADEVEPARAFHLRFPWVEFPQESLVLVALGPHAPMIPFDEACEALSIKRHYSNAAAIAWIASSAAPNMQALLQEFQLPGLLLQTPRTTPVSPFLGTWSPSPFLERLKPVFDPTNKFLPWVTPTSG